MLGRHFPRNFWSMWPAWFWVGFWTSVGFWKKTSFEYMFSICNMLYYTVTLCSLVLSYIHIYIYIFMYHTSQFRPCLHVFLSNQKTEVLRVVSLKWLLPISKDSNPKLMWRPSSLIKERPPRKLVPKDECTSSPRFRGESTCHLSVLKTRSCVERFWNERFQNNLHFMSLLFFDKLTWLFF